MPWLDGTDREARSPWVGYHVSSAWSNSLVPWEPSSRRNTRGASGPTQGSWTGAIAMTKYEAYILPSHEGSLTGDNAMRKDCSRVG